MRQQETKIMEAEETTCEVEFSCIALVVKPERFTCKANPTI
jgi:hypothetical protein